MKESSLRTRIANALRKRGAKVEVKHNSRFAKTGEPDLYGCYKGRAFVFEVKLVRGKPTKLQLHRLNEWHVAGAITGVVRSVKEALCLLKQS